MSIDSLFDWGTATDVGRVRNNNEDALATAPELGVFVLADGMGGHKSGEIASKLAITSILDHLQKSLPQLAPGQIDIDLGYTRESIAIREAVIHANHVIHHAAQEQIEHEGMGTTVVLIGFYGTRMTIAHVGDSRVYRFRNDQLEQLTSDHTMLQELVDRGFYTEEEAQKSMHKNLVTRALGVDSSVAVDIQEDIVLPGDIYLLCSDGLHDFVDDNHIAEHIASCDDLDTCSNKLMNEANANGGKDNISLILIRPKGDFKISKSWIKRIGEWLKS